jgi:PAS domain S-box-containing protein
LENYTESFTYKAVFESSPDAIIISDDEGNIVMVNKQAENLFGFTREEMLGQAVELVIPKRYHKRHCEKREKYVEHPTVRRMGEGLELWAKRRDGSEFPVEISLSPIELPDKMLVAAAVRDVTERIAVEKKLLENEGKFRTTLDNMLEGALVVGFDWRYLYLNNAMARQSKAPKEELLGKTMMENFPGIEQSEVFKIYQECMEKRITKQVIMPYTFPNGSHGWFDLSIQPIPEGLFILSVEITERKKAQQALIESEEKYRYMFEMNPQPMWIFDIESLKLLNVNEAAIKHYGYSKQEFLNLTVQDIRPTETVDFFLEKLAIQRPDFNDAGTWKHKKKNGEIIVVKILSHIINYEQHKARLVIATDVTEQKKAEEEIAAQKRFTEAVLNNLPADIAVFDHNHNYVFINQQAIKDPETRQWLIGKNDFDYCSHKGIDDSLARKRRAFFNEALQSKADVEWVDEHQTKQGTTIHILRKFHPVFEDGKIKYVIGYGVDITRRKKIEEELLSTRKHYQHLLDSSPVIIYSAETKRPYRPTYVSENIKAQLGYEPKEFLDLSDSWVDNIHPEDVERFFAEVASLFTHDKQTIEYRFRHTDGTYRWMLDEVMLIRDEQGNPKEFVGAWMDITERKNADIKLKEAMQASQVAYREMEQFAYMVSHDLQEPLRMVSGFLNLLESEIEDQLNEAAKEYIDFAIDGAERMKILIQDLLQYSRVGTNKEDFTDIDPNEILAYVTHVLAENIQQVNGVVKASPLPLITGNKTLLTQLFLNLVGNALKYHSDKTPEIEIGCVEEKEDWRFYVKDNGIGIDPKYFDKIFVIFHRVHARSEYAGTGIGLAICKKIVEKHQGRIWVESELGKGSTFYFTVPKNIL